MHSGQAKNRCQHAGKHSFTAASSINQGFERPYDFPYFSDIVL
jgi:hypothetical protein